MDDFAKLELSTETLRDLTDDELSRVAGGANPTGTTVDTTVLGGPTGTFQCPSGRTWTANCQITIATG
jgi:hypothetical protein